MRRPVASFLLGSGILLGAASIASFGWFLLIPCLIAATILVRRKQLFWPGVALGAVAVIATLGIVILSQR